MLYNKCFSCCISSASLSFVWITRIFVSTIDTNCKLRSKTRNRNFLGFSGLETYRGGLDNAFWFPEGIRWNCSQRFWIGPGDTALKSFTKNKMKLQSQLLIGTRWNCTRRFFRGTIYFCPSITFDNNWLGTEIRYFALGSLLLNPKNTWLMH